MGKKAVAPQIFWGPRPPNLRPPKSKFTHFQSCVKVSWRSPEPSRRYSAAKCHKKKKEITAKHKPTWNYRSGWPNEQTETLAPVVPWLPGYNHPLLLCSRCLTVNKGLRKIYTSSVLQLSLKHNHLLSHTHTHQHADNAEVKTATVGGTIERSTQRRCQLF